MLSSILSLFSHFLPLSLLTLYTPIVVFLERLQSYTALPHTHIQHLGTLYGFLGTPNAELRWRFYEVALLDPASPAAQQFAAPAAQWIVGTDGTGIVRGRMKFCRPLFRAVARADKKLAVEVFREHRLAFHPIAQRLIEKVRVVSWGEGECGGGLLTDRCVAGPWACVSETGKDNCRCQVCIHMVHVVCTNNLSRQRDVVPPLPRGGSWVQFRVDVWGGCGWACMNPDLCSRRPLLLANRLMPPSPGVKGSL